MEYGYLRLVMDIVTLFLCYILSSEVEALVRGASPAGSEPSLLFSNNFYSLGLESVQDKFSITLLG